LEAAFLYFMRSKDKKSAISVSVVASSSQQQGGSKAKGQKGLHSRTGVFLIPANLPNPCRGNVFSGKEIQ
jgi:hypothetical protein